MCAHAQIPKLHPINSCAVHRTKVYRLALLVGYLHGDMIRLTKHHVHTVSFKHTDRDLNLGIWITRVPKTTARAQVNSPY